MTADVESAVAALRPAVAHYLTQSRDGWTEGRSEPERIFPVADASESHEQRGR